MSAEFLHLCAVTLANDDVDRAQEANGIGFSANDSAFGHRLAKSDPSSWSEQLTADAWHALVRYRKQLASVGLDIEAIPEPKLEKSSDRKSNTRFATFDNGRFTLAFPYDPDVVASVKTLEGRRYDAETKVWSVPASSSAEVALLCARYGFSKSEGATSALTQEHPTQPDTKPVGGTLTQHGARFHLKFPYDPEAVKAVKEINGRRWEPDEKVWVIPISSVRLVFAFCDQFGIDISAFMEVPDSDPVIEPDITIDQFGFVIRFPYDRDIVQQVRDLPTATFDKLVGGWRVARSASIEVAVFAQSTNAVSNQTVADIFVEANEQLARIDKSRAKDAELNIPTLNGTLLPFQRAGVVYALEALNYEPSPDGVWRKKQRNA